MDILTPLLLIFIFVTLFIGIFVYFSNKKSENSSVFLFFCLFTAIWMTGVLFTARPPSTYIGNIAFRLAFLGISLSAADFIYFVQIFPERKFLPKAVSILFIGSLVAIGLISISTNLVADKINYLNGVTIEKKYGPLYPIFSIILVSSLLLSIIFSVLKYKKLKDEIKKRQAAYFLTGIFLSFVLSISTNLISPLFKLGPYEIPQYGPISFIFFIVFSAFAILRYRLFDIKMIATEILVIAMGLVLLSFPFLMSTNAQRILAIVVFMVFCWIGYLLIKTSLKEVKNNELLEQKVKERTKELQESKDELEKFYHLTIGRELRMAELKEKIRELEQNKI